MNPATQRLLPAARWLAVRAGRATAGSRVTPSFLICGAQRCGTTSMYQALRQHPAVVRPVLHKGVHYFDVAYPNGMAWYRAHFPLAATVRRREQATGFALQAFESSPYYLFHPLVAERIAADLPGVRVLILVRDPVERAYSAYTHEFARGYETESFERALELEPSRLAGEEAKLVADAGYVSHAHRHQAYVARGRFVDQIQRMVGALGPDRVHVVDAGDFFAEPEPVWADVARFLNLPGDVVPQFRRHNARPRSSLDPGVRRWLEAQFEDADERLAQWWQRTPSWRREPPRQT